MDLFHTFNKISEKMQSDLEQIREANKHPQLKGTQFEGIFRDFLKIYLPKTLDVSTGTIIDSDGRQSNQLDVIISDHSKAPILYEKEQIRTIPVECVYSVIEVKAKLDINELQKCFPNMKSVRQLQKKAYFRRQDFPRAYMMYGQRYEIWPIHYFIFAFDSINPDTLRDYINMVHNQERLPLDSRIDSVCILNKTLICNLLKNGVYNALPEPGSKLVNYETTKSLLLFYTLTMHLLCQCNMPDFKFMDYLGEAFLF